jgi:Xaa-Pro aminopeptidase
MTEKGVSAAIISNIENVRWISGFSGSYGIALLTQNDAIFISDSRYSEQAHEQVEGLEVQIFATPKTGAEMVAEAAKRLGADSIGFESEHVTFALHKSWKDKLNGISLQPVAELIDPLRMVKSSEELKSIREACALADACYEHATRMLQVGVAEFDVALDIEFFIRRNGANLAFPAHVVSGPRSARPHGEPSERKFENGDFVTMDFGASVNGYCSDITRTVVIGEPTERHREVYGAVLESQLAAIDAIKPGVPTKDVDILSREILDKYGLAKYFGHGLGHGLGRLVHDVGRLSSLSTDIFAPGQVWTVEPGVYIEGFGGVRIEDDIVVTETSCEILTKAPKQLTSF